MDGPETVIALSAVARNSGPIALILLRGPLKITFSGGWSHYHIQWGGGRAPREHGSGSLSTAGLSKLITLLHLLPCLIQKYECFHQLRLYHPLKTHLLKEKHILITMIESNHT